MKEQSRWVDMVQSSRNEQIRGKEGKSHASLIYQPLKQQFKSGVKHTAHGPGSGPLGIEFSPLDDFEKSEC